MFKRFVFVMCVFALPVMAEEVTEPFCDQYVTRTVMQHLQDAGYLRKGEIEIKNESFEARVIGFKKLGVVYFGPYFKDIPNNILYQIIVHLKTKGEDNTVYEVVAIGEVSTLECEMSRPLVILTSPEYKILGAWQSWLQYEKRVRHSSRGDYSILTPTPNLVAEPARQPSALMRALAKVDGRLERRSENNHRTYYTKRQELIDAALAQFPGAERDNPPEDLLAELVDCFDDLSDSNFRMAYLPYGGDFHIPLGWVCHAALTGLVYHEEVEAEGDITRWDGYPDFPATLREMKAAKAAWQKVLREKTYLSH